MESTLESRSGIQLSSVGIHPGSYLLPSRYSLASEVPASSGGKKKAKRIFSFKNNLPCTLPMSGQVEKPMLAVFATLDCHGLKRNISLICSALLFLDSEAINALIWGPMKVASP